MSGQQLYAQVILPLAVEGLYTYVVPGELQGRIVPGSRVLVSFGNQLEKYLQQVISRINDKN